MDSIVLTALYQFSWVNLILGTSTLSHQIIASSTNVVLNSFDTFIKTRCEDENEKKINFHGTGDWTHVIKIIKHSRSSALPKELICPTRQLWKL